MMLSDAGLVLALEFEAAGLKDSVLDAIFPKKYEMIIGLDMTISFDWKL
jgi:hypothetical protein